MTIRTHNLRKRFGSFEALRGIDLEVPSGQLVALLGPSGSGKTTLLRVIAGLEAADEGHVLYGEDDVTGLSVRQRNVGFVFQHYALFQNMSVFENVAFGLRVRKWKAPEVKARVEELLKLIQLQDLAKRYPSQLSGGQRQRVALARALAPQPQVLLLDEPFGALDAKVRQELRSWLRRLHEEIHVTSVFVTHDQDEAFEVADRVVVMHQGQIEQEGAPDEVFTRPSSRFVMEFLGSARAFDASVQAGRAQFGGFETPAPHAESGAATAFVRPHEWLIARTPQEQSLSARVESVRRAGPLVKVSLRPEVGEVIEAEIDHLRDVELNLQAGDRVFLAPQQARVFAPSPASVKENTEPTRPQTTPREVIRSPFADS